MREVKRDCYYCEKEIDFSDGNYEDIICPDCKKEVRLNYEIEDDTEYFTVVPKAHHG